MERFKSAVIVSAVSVSLGAAVLLHAQRGSGGPPAQDPGVRAGSVGAGTPLSTLNSDQVQFFQDGLARFVQVDSVEGGAPGEPGIGLGPGFNANSCGSCHAQPSIGGTSPSQSQYPFLGPNPQMAIANDYSATNIIPSFITPDGPVREARFPFLVNPNGRVSNNPDGGVHDVFTIAGRQDAAGCTMPQPNFEAMQQANNIIYRIPTPVFGAGLIEAIPDSAILSNMAANASVKQMLGITGHPNTSGNDGTITRFGWKAQNKSLLIFAGEAYNVEQGVTNEAFPNERESAPDCQFNGTPEDTTNLVPTVKSVSPASDFSSDIVNFAGFMRLSAGPLPAPPNPSTVNGQHVFTSIGCAACHLPVQTTGKSAFTGQSFVSFAPYSDFALHDMGENLADDISQGSADGNQVRTAPLWGLGQRLFFLHDGRSNTLVDAIHQHASSGSEANAVVNNYELLSARNQQDLLNFLRSL